MSRAVTDRSLPGQSEAALVCLHAAVVVVAVGVTLAALASSPLCECKLLLFHPQLVVAVSVAIQVSNGNTTCCWLVCLLACQLIYFLQPLPSQSPFSLLLARMRIRMRIIIINSQVESVCKRAIEVAT